MTLSTGIRLSHYEITPQLRRGGVGAVYQANDRKLGRDVAIKVLPAGIRKLYQAWELWKQQLPFHAR